MFMTEHEYLWIKGLWEGPEGAAFNAVYEDLYEAGFITRNGLTTPKGYKAIQEYEMKEWNI